jgi:hypothetical protein
MSLDPSSYRRAQYDQRSPGAAQHKGRRHEWQRPDPPGEEFPIDRNFIGNVKRLLKNGHAS